MLQELSFKSLELVLTLAGILEVRHQGVLALEEALVLVCELGGIVQRVSASRPYNVSWVSHNDADVRHARGFEATCGFQQSAVHNDSPSFAQHRLEEPMVDMVSGRSAQRL